MSSNTSVLAEATNNNVDAASSTNTPVVTGILMRKKRWGWKSRFLTLYLNGLRKRHGKHISCWVGRYVLVALESCFCFLKINNGYPFLELQFTRNICMNRGFAHDQMDQLDKNTFKHMF
jgi:hypothetical protein